MLLLRFPVTYLANFLILCYCYNCVTSGCANNGCSEYWECNRISGHPDDPPDDCVSYAYGNEAIINGSVYPQLKFSYDGRIKRILYYAHSLGKIVIGVWRYMDTTAENDPESANQLQLVGKVILVATSLGLNEEDIAEGGRFNVQKGDMLGHHFDTSYNGHGVLCVGGPKEVFTAASSYYLNVKKVFDVNWDRGQVVSVIFNESYVVSPGVQAVLECICNEGCADGKCDVKTGQCAPCKPGWSGNFCSEACPKHYYGVSCSYNCEIGCVGQLCDTEKGLCVMGCQPGYLGGKCDTKCEDGFYGQFCENICGFCADSKPCLYSYGICTNGCQIGYAPPFCNSTCTPGNYGPNCAFTCGKCDIVTNCRPSDGFCTNGCALGWLGDQCWISVSQTSCVSPAKLQQLQQLQLAATEQVNIATIAPINPNLTLTNVVKRKFGQFNRNKSSITVTKLGLMFWVLYASLMP